MKIDRIAVYNKFDGHCAYCGREITFKQLQVDHFWPQMLSNFEAELDKNRFDNLMPSCQKCNSHKGGYRIEEWRAMLQAQVAMLRRSARFDRALRFGQLETTEKPIVFYFEKEEA